MTVQKDGQAMIGVVEMIVAKENAGQGKGELKR